MFLLELQIEVCFVL